MKVTGPLMSLEASGTLASAFTALRTRRGAVMRKRIIPMDPLTPRQRAQRALVRSLPTKWAANSAIIRALTGYFTNLVPFANYHQYLGTNMTRWGQTLAPKMFISSDVVEFDPGFTSNVFGGSGQVTWVPDQTSELGLWGAALFLSNTPIVEPDHTKIVAVITAEIGNGGNPTAVINRLTPGSYEWAYQAFSPAGQWWPLWNFGAPITVSS